MPYEIPKRLVRRRGHPPPIAVVAELHLRRHEWQVQLLAQAECRVVGGGEDERAHVQGEPVNRLSAAASAHMVLGLEQEGSDAPPLQRVGGAEAGEAPANDNDALGAHRGGPSFASINRCPRRIARGRRRAIQRRPAEPVNPLMVDGKSQIVAALAVASEKS